MEEAKCGEKTEKEKEKERGGRWSGQESGV